MMACRFEAKALAEKILTAAGSGLRHYTPQNREAIIKAADEAVEDLWHKLSRDDHPYWNRKTGGCP